MSVSADCRTSVAEAAKAIARGGIVIAIHDQLDIPVKMIGIGEAIDDLRDFDPDEFVDALFG